jgi:hypothetical protein
MRSDAGPPPKVIDIVDTNDRHDAANMSLFVTNIGSLGFDLATGNSGLEFPIGSGQTALFASGLWVGATVAGQTRVTVAEYSMEYGPGRVFGGSPEPDNPQLRNYKVQTITAPAPPDTNGWGDYVANAGPQGAPVGTRRLPNTSTPDPTDSVDVSGPDLPGEAAIWCVFNDADPNGHTNNAGNTAPMGLEVRQTVFSKLFGPAVYVLWQIRNGGSAVLQNTYVSFWSDVDLGGAPDDLVGYDVPIEMGYTYNATNNDSQYGATPPAVGTMLVLGPLDPAAGVRRPAYAFSKYINGTDPNSFVQSYNYMRGLNADGTPVIDPITAQPTRFQHTGDPVLGTGWLDTNPSDRRMMLTAGPLTLAPGQSTDLVVAFVVHQANDRLSSITKLRCKAEYARQQYLAGFPAIPEPDCAGPVPALLYFEESEVTEGGVRLVWMAGDRLGGPYALERRRNPGTYGSGDGTPEWEHLALVSPDGVGRILYEDGDVAPGDRLTYRLVDPNSGEELQGGRASVTVPASATGSLELTALTPDRNGTRVSFRLPHAGPVAFELFDVRGRRLSSIDLGELDGGTHTRRLDLGAAAPSGLALVRLRFAGETRVAKAMFLSTGQP